MPFLVAITLQVLFLCAGLRDSFIQNPVHLTLCTDFIPFSNDWRWIDDACLCSRRIPVEAPQVDDPEGDLWVGRACLGVAEGAVPDVRVPRVGLVERQLHLSHLMIRFGLAGLCDILCWQTIIFVFVYSRPAPCPG